MTWSPLISTDRRAAIGRAARAVVRLAIDPEAAPAARRLNTIANEVTAYTDREAWEAVAALEDMVVRAGLVTEEQIEAERRAAAVAVADGRGCGPVMYAGDEDLAHSQQHPELYDGEGDPLDYPCEECGADAGHECRPCCTAIPGVQHLHEQD